MCDKTFWKYNFIYHMISEHIDHTSADTTLPPIPIPLRLASHISRSEEEKMGVEAELTRGFRDRWGIPNSDAVEPVEKTAHGTMEDQEMSSDHGSQGGQGVGTGGGLQAQSIPPPAEEMTSTPTAGDSRKRAYSSAAMSIATTTSSYRTPPANKVLKLYF
jgi:hypothetical protein